MAAGKILLTLTKQLKKLVERKKITDSLLKNKSMSKAERVKAEKSSVRLGKSADRVTKQMNEAKTTSKDPQKLATEVRNKKSKSPDKSNETVFGAGKLGQKVKSKNMRGGDKFLETVEEQIKKQNAKVRAMEKRGTSTIEEKRALMQEQGKLDRLKTKAKNMRDDLGYKKPNERVSFRGPVVKKPMGGKVYKNTVSRKHGGAIGVGSALRGFGKGYKKG